MSRLLSRSVSRRDPAHPAMSQSVTFVARKHTLPELGYAYDALEPAISAEIMELHHSKHHQTYVTGLNNAEEQLAQALQAGDTQKQIALQAALKFNGPSGGREGSLILAGGGHISPCRWHIVASDRHRPLALLEEPCAAQGRRRRAAVRIDARQGDPARLWLLRPVQGEADRGGPRHPGRACGTAHARLKLGTERMGVALVQQGEQPATDRDDRQPGPADEHGPHPWCVSASVLHADSAGIGAHLVSLDAR